MRNKRFVPALVLTFGPVAVLLFVLAVAKVSDNLLIFHVLSVVVPILLAWLLPRELARRKAPEEPEHRWLLYVACALYFVSWYLPSPLIDNQDTAFTTHLIGGGIFTGLLWVYLVKSAQPKLGWTLEFFSLFALVSALGVVNELAELFFAVGLNIDITLTDTNIDLLANTLGAFIVYGVYALQKITRN